jgi:DNA recombination protein RmuC
MLQCDCHIGGKVVEFALVLSDGRLLPIDSKWPAADLLEALDRETEPDARARVAADIEKMVAKRANEVAQYIDAERTLPWAIAAIPDAAYAVCRKVQWEAYNRGVIVLSYGMAMPFLLALFGLYLRYTRGVDMENVHARLIEMGRLLDTMEQTQETKLQRGNTMIANAITDHQRAIFALRACIEAMQALAPCAAEPAPPPPA